MKSNQKIAVIGGTGKSGTYLVKELLSRNFHVNLLVRNPEKIPEDSHNLTVIIGDVLMENKVEKLIQGCDAVVSTLGLGIPASTPDLFEKASLIILKTMSSFGIKRYILTTGLNVTTPSDQKVKRFCKPLLGWSKCSQFPPKASKMNMNLF
ncbi:NAD(P)H-binding protein [Algoriphagus halophilus]|uniref:NAD(P)-dependent oxidoreductase n=1 Tax=Algoriphagus halophilus TaxID=226505 RepID=UPI00358EFB4B